jgi:predicted methyltransferase
MKRMTPTRILVAAALLAAIGTTAFAATLPANIVASAADPRRAESAKNDGWRHGPEIVAFAGVKPGAKVIDLIPGGGYWTRLFAGAVGPKGHVYGIWPSEYVKVDGEDFEPYKKVAALYPNTSVHEQPAAALTAPEKVDLIFTSQNYHDYPLKFMGNTDVAILNKAAFAALKPGGIYLVIDHAAEAGSGMRDIDKLHRIDGAAVKAQVEAAGFKYVGESKLLVSAVDDKTKNVFAKEVRGKTDQFIYKFRKP